MLNSRNKISNLSNFGVRKWIKPTNIEGLHFVPEVIGDTAKFSNNTINTIRKILGTNLDEYVEKGVIDTSKFQQDFLSKTYDKLKTPEERAVFSHKLRETLDWIKKRKIRDFSRCDTQEEDLKWLKNNMQFLTKESQERAILLLKQGKVPDWENIRLTIDDNKVFDLIMKDKKYNFEYVLQDMQDSKLKIYDDIDLYSQKIDDALAKIEFNSREIQDPIISSKLENLDISKYYDIPIYHAVNVGNNIPPKYIEYQLEKYGATRFHDGPNPNILFTTTDIYSAKRIAINGSQPILEFRLRKEMPILTHKDLGIGHHCGCSRGYNAERCLMLDLLYEKGVKFYKDTDTTFIIIDPKAITTIGHSKVSTTQRYAHPVPERKMDAVEILSSYFSEQTKPS